MYRLFHWFRRPRVPSPPAVLVVEGRDALMAMGCEIELSREQLRNGCTIVITWG